MTWTKFGEGSYNTVYKDSADKQVLKIQKQDNIADCPNRSARLWNEINPHLSPIAYVVNSEFGKGWVCPYVKGRSARDHEIMLGVLDIFQRTGRIIVDATAPKNFLVTDDGYVVCVDIGMAVQLEQRELAFQVSPRARRTSIASLEVWNDKRPSYTSFFKTSSKGYPQSTEIIKALLFIKINRPDIYNVDFLKDNPKLRAKLATAYDTQVQESSANIDDQEIAHPSIRIAESLDVLLNIRMTTLQNIKDSCINELQRYIDSRGSLNDKQEFKPSLTTRLFRDLELTTYKTGDALRLLNALQRAESLEQIRKLLESIPGKVLLFASSYSSGYEASIGRCQNIIATMQDQYNLDYIEEQNAKLHL